MFGSEDDEEDAQTADIVEAGDDPEGSDDDLSVDGERLEDVGELLDADKRWSLPGEWAADEIAKTAVRFAAPIPWSEAFWKRINQYAMRGMRESAGGARGEADAIVMTYRGNGLIEPVPVARYQSDDPEKGDLWHSTDWSDVWVGSPDDVVIGPGNVPTAVAAGDSYALGDQLQLRADKALQLNDDGPFFETNGVTVREDVERSVVVDDTGQAGAVADGGVDVDAVKDISDRVVARDVDPDVAGIGDYAIDLRGTDSRLLSYWSYKETYPEKLGSEEHKNAEHRGRMAEMDEDKDQLLMKLLIISGAIIVLSLAAVVGIPMLFGSGGGGGGSLVPIFTGLMGAI